MRRLNLLAAVLLLWGLRVASAQTGAPRLTLDPQQFDDSQIRAAYTAAAEHPELFAQLHCYCGRDVTDHHKSLLDCYRDRHGATCQVCTDEALQAAQMYAQSSPVEQIQNALRRRFTGR
jgi:tRNA isopentenyl-2-thiomethyl-A-37 hydroxylase MiaE